LEEGYSQAVTVTVGKKQTDARYFLDSVSDVELLLSMFTDDGVLLEN
jgi:hypothetical protein